MNIIQEIYKNANDLDRIHQYKIADKLDNFARQAGLTLGPIAGENNSVNNNQSSLIILKNISSELNTLIQQTQLYPILNQRLVLLNQNIERVYQSINNNSINNNQQNNLTNTVLPKNSPPVLSPTNTGGPSLTREDGQSSYLAPEYNHTINMPQSQ